VITSIASGPIRIAITRIAALRLKCDLLTLGRSGAIVVLERPQFGQNRASEGSLVPQFVQKGKVILQLSVLSALLKILSSIENYYSE